MKTIMKAINYGCGFNINNQISSEDLDIICCPVEISYFNLNNTKCSPVSISLSHIVWSTCSTFKVTGFKNKNFDEDLLKLSHLVKSSEKKIVYLQKNGEIFVNTGNETKKIILQEDKSDRIELEDSEIKDLALEENSIILLSKDGSIFNPDVQVTLPGMKIKQVCVGKEHCLAITDSGEVLSWGSGMRGQLGIGELTTVDDAIKISALGGIFIISISCGGWHSAALSSSGDVYVWGWNDVGQLGFPSKSLREKGVHWDDIFEPHQCRCSRSRSSGSTQRSESNKEETGNSHQQVASEEINVQALPKVLDFWSLDKSVKKVACGDRHSLFLLDDDSVWSTGWNLYGQLGIGCIDSKDQPQKVPITSVTDIYAGGWNSIFSVSVNN